MWSKLKKLGNPPTAETALEIVRSDGTISTDIKEILCKWFNDISISHLFSGIRDSPSMAFDDQFLSEIMERKNEFEHLIKDYDLDPQNNSSTLNNAFTFMEVSKVIDSCNKRKSLFGYSKQSCEKSISKDYALQFL